MIFKPYEGRQPQRRKRTFCNVSLVFLLAKYRDQKHSHKQEGPQTQNIYKVRCKDRKNGIQKTAFSPVSL
jgi:hypothetical protein